MTALSRLRHRLSLFWIHRIAGADFSESAKVAALLLVILLLHGVAATNDYAEAMAQEAKAQATRADRLRAQLDRGGEDVRP